MAKKTDDTTNISASVRKIILPKENIDFKLDNISEHDFDGESGFANSRIITRCCWAVGLQRNKK